MAFQEIIDAALNPIFGWLLNIPPILAILFLSLLLGLLSILLQKYMTDQAKMKRLKEDTKKYQKQIKEAQKKKDQKKMMKIQQKMMPLQMSLMKESFKPLLVTMIPFLIIFFWLSNHFAFYPIVPDEPFTVTAEFEEGLGGEATLSVPEQLSLTEPTKQVEDGVATWTLVGPPGRYTLELAYAGATVSREVLITEEREYVQPEKPLSGSVESFNVNNKKLLPAGNGFALFGWKPGWIFWYILFSIPISLGLKKLLGVV